ncbi:MAG: hypothetical protein WC730_00955 [Patescibacteria group bacterium]|jgi:hypothetical protein
MALAKRLGIFFASVLCTGMFCFLPTAQAQTVGEQYNDIMDQGLIYANICTGADDDCACRDTGECTLDDLLQVVVNISVFLLGISGTAVLCVFIYGGFLWITAQGKPEAIKTGQKAIVGAVIGIVIIFSSYAIIAFVVSVLKTGESPEGEETISDILDNAGSGDAHDILNTTTE